MTLIRFFSVEFGWFLTRFYTRPFIQEQKDMLKMNFYPRFTVNLFLNANSQITYRGTSQFIIWQKFLITFQRHFTTRHNVPSLTLFFYGPGDHLDIKHAPWQSSSIAPGGAITFYCLISKGQNSSFNWSKWEKWDMLLGWLAFKYISLRAPSEWNMAAFVVVVELMDVT